MGFRLILLGPPGVGKGTQAEFIKKRFDLCHISMGDILREAVRNRTPVGLKARRYMDAGTLIPDELVGEIIEEKMREDDVRERFLLDGFPRTERQVEILDAILQKVHATIDAAFLIELDEEEIVRRLSGRRVCSGCGTLYHLTSKPPRIDGICDRCEGSLIQRKDDSEAVIRERLLVYRKETLPIVDIYDSRGILVRIDGSGNSEEVQRRILARLQEFRA
ncbi:MAG: adenylate kinase [Acidobacteriota bacterium]